MKVSQLGENEIRVLIAMYNLFLNEISVSTNMESLESSVRFRVEILQDRLDSIHN